MARSTPKGLTVWDLTTDSFSHSQLAANWDLIDSLLSTASQSIQTLAAVPSTSNFAGRLVMLSAADSGFPAWTILRYDGSQWRSVGPLEILPAIPTLGNFAGRVVILSVAAGGFSQWSLIGYDGTQWNAIGGFSSVSTGGGALNISGLSTAGDVYYTNPLHGPVMVDRVTGTKYRLYMASGALLSEAVT